MRRVHRGATSRALASLMLFGGVACTTGVNAPKTTDFSGTYQVDASLQAISCSPQDLPTALSTDSAQYVQMPPAPPVSSQVLVQEAGSDLAIVPLDSNGNPQVAFWLRGSLDLATATGSLSRTATPFTEGPRQGGHTFYVSETVEATARFRPLIGTPAGGTPGGTVVGAAEQTTSADVFIFRDGGANGTIFTTCVVSDTTSATRGAS